MLVITQRSMNRDHDAIITIPVEFMAQMVAENKPIQIVQTAGTIKGSKVTTGFEAPREVTILRRSIAEVV